MQPDIPQRNRVKAQNCTETQKPPKADPLDPALLDRFAVQLRLEGALRSPVQRNPYCCHGFMRYPADPYHKFDA